MPDRFFTEHEKKQIREHLDNGGFFFDLPAALLERIYDVLDVYCEMPYGTQKARTGDPEEWLYDRIWEYL